MAKKPMPAPICGKCGLPIDRAEVLDALAKGLRYVHGCGRVLVSGTMP